MMESIQAGFEQLVEVAILLMEFIGVVVMVVTAIKAVVGVFRKDRHVRLRLAEGIALALEFKLGGEVLRTLVVRSLSELAMLGAVVLLRAAIAVLIQWGIKKEEARFDDDRVEAPAPAKPAKAQTQPHGFAADTQPQAFVGDVEVAET